MDREAIGLSLDTLRLSVPRTQARILRIAFYNLFWEVIMAC